MLSEEKLALLQQVAAGVTAQFGKSCEVVIHDLTEKDLEHSLVHIENGHVSGRKIGSGASHAVLEALNGADGATIPDHFAYLARTTSGKVLKSTTIFIRDANGKPEAIFGINFDISVLSMLENTLGEFISPVLSATLKPEKITTSVEDLLEELIARAIEQVGKPVALMDREDKKKAVRFLSESGAMLITKSGDKISKALNISKFTLYSYLEREE